MKRVLLLPIAAIFFEFAALAQTFSERFRTQLRVETYNVFNRPQFGQPGQALSNPGTFGLSTDTVARADGTTSNRQIQLALKVYF